MASTDVAPWPVKNRAYRAHFLILDATGAPVTGGAGLDCQVSKDQAAFAAAAGTETEIGNGWYYCDLSATEMNADTIIAVLKTSTTGAKTAHMMVHPVSIDELSAAPTFGSGGSGIEEVLSWLLALNRNKITQTSSTTTLFKNDNSTTLSTASTSDDGTTFTRAKFS